jgi:hypothetical protein
MHELNERKSEIKWYCSNLSVDLPIELQLFFNHVSVTLCINESKLEELESLLLMKLCVWGSHFYHSSALVIWSFFPISLPILFKAEIGNYCKNAMEYVLLITNTRDTLPLLFSLVSSIQSLSHEKDFHGRKCFGFKSKGTLSVLFELLYTVKFRIYTSLIDATTDWYYAGNQTTATNQFIIGYYALLSMGSLTITETMDENNF